MIRKVWKRNAGNTDQLLVTIEKDNKEGIKEGDHVKISKVPINIEVD